MRVKRLVLCMMLSLALVVTFIPMFSFAADGDEPVDAVGAPAVEEPAVDTADMEEMHKEAAKGEVSAKDVDEDATAELVLVGNRDLVCDYDADDFNFPIEGDMIIVTFSDNTTKTYEYVYDDAEEHYDFYCGDECLNWSRDMPQIGDTSFEINVWDYSGDPEFDIYFFVPVTVVSNIKSIAFSPATITVYSEDIKETYGSSVYYNLEYRHKITWQGNTYYSPFNEGDAITVYYANGTSKVFRYKTYFTYVEGDNTNSDYDLFVNGNDTIYPDAIYDCWELVPGKNNIVTIKYGGVETTFTVFVDTPALRAARAEAAAEAARQGVYSGSMPAVKASKPKAAKKAITVKWKKLKKKQLKSGVSRIEVWVSTNTAFARGATIEKTVGKKKASVKIKGLKKGVTYYAKVRAIKYVNGQKVVGKWSGVKKVKVKK